MESLIGTLGIDWRLFLGQIVNFLIFMVVLRVFAYRPLLSLMEKRRQRIQDGLELARKQEDLVESIALEKKAILKETRVQAEAMLAEAREKSLLLQEQMFAAAELRVSEIGARAKADITKEKERVHAELKEFAGELSIAIAEKILKEHIDESKEEHIIREMLKQVD